MAVLDQIKKQLWQFVKPEEEKDLRKREVKSPYETPRSSFSQETSVSHGFDQIYALETIDVRTVRPLNGGVKEIEELSASTPIEPVQASFSKELEEGELLLDLGHEYRGWIESFRLSEPLQVLKLSSLAEKALLDAGKVSLKDLMGFSTSDTLAIKGMGQGHVDEIHYKLEKYLGNMGVLRSRSVDFIGLLRCLLATMEPVKRSLCMAPYDLTDLFPLSQAQSMELRHLGEDKKQELWAQSVLEAQNDKRTQFFQRSIRQVADVFIRPWVRGRLGLATHYELSERLEKVSSDGDRTSQILAFLSETYCHGRFLLSDALKEVEKGLYCADEWIARDVRCVLGKTRSYFYHPHLKYRLSDLISWLEREFAREWRDFPEGFLVKLLRLSHEFLVWKAKDHHLWVRRVGEGS